MATDDAWLNPNEHPHAVTRRGLLQATGVILGGAALGLAPSQQAHAAGSGRGGIDVENLGVGVSDFHVFSGLLLGDTFYIGTRNLSPTRIAAYHLPTNKVTATYMLGDGNFVQALAADGSKGLYAGIGQAADTVNIYRVDLTTGDVVEIAAVSGLYIRDLAVAPDGILYIVGRPVPHAAGPALYSYDPGTGELRNLGVPAPGADEANAVAVTDTTVYFGCGSLLSPGTPAQVFAIDRATGQATDITPPGLANDFEVTTGGMAILDGILAVGTQAVEAEYLPGHVAFLDLASGQWRVVPDYTGYAMRGFVRKGDEVIVSSRPGQLAAIDLSTLAVRHLDTGSSDVGVSWADMGLYGDLVLGTIGSNVWTYDLVSGSSHAYDLADLGAVGGPLLGMSVGADDEGRVYVAATGWVAVHDLSAGSVTRFAVPGEVKDMVVVDGTVYMGVYNSQGLWEYRPGQAPRHLADFPVGQNRPSSVRWDDVNGLVVVGIMSDPGGGSLCLYDPAVESMVSHVNPLDDSQAVLGVATGHGLVYIGGNRGDIAAWDPVAGHEVWRMALPFRETAQQRIPRVTSLVVVGRRLYGTTQRSFFVVDIKPSSGPKLIHQVNLNAFTDTGAEDAQLLVDRGKLYAVSAHSVVRIDPVDFTLTLLLADLGGEWYGYPHVAADGGHNLYTLAGRDLVRIRD